MFKTANIDGRIEFLATVSLFRELHRRQLQHVASLTTEIVVPPDRVLCEKGQRGDEFFIIRSGEVQVADGPTLSDGDFFGEMALLNQEPRNATVTTTQPTDLLVLSRQEFRELGSVDPHIGDELKRAILARQPRPSLAEV